MCIRDRSAMSRASASRSWDSAVGSMRSAGMGVSSAVAALPGRAVGAQPASGSRGYQRTYLGTVNGVDERLHTGSVTDGSALDPTLSATESGRGQRKLSLIHISEPTRLLSISYAVFCLKKKNNKTKITRS